MKNLLLIFTFMVLGGVVITSCSKEETSDLLVGTVWEYQYDEVIKDKTTTKYIKSHNYVSTSEVEISTFKRIISINPDGDKVIIEPIYSSSYDYSFTPPLVKVEFDMSDQKFEQKEIIEDNNNKYEVLIFKNTYNGVENIETYYKK